MTTVSNAVAERDTAGPAALVESYSKDFAAVLPSHVSETTWVRLAVGALRRNRDLLQAAQNDPGALMQALLHAARLGLEPGTEEYWLTVRKDKGVPKVLGIPGYQGLIELIYRAGVASSVIVEVVYTGDRFTYVPGRDPRPIHEIDWDADDRGDLRLAYAYAIMKGGATSKVVVLNKTNIARSKQAATGASSEHSPWRNDEAAMWLKSAVRQLVKWVPTSSEYRDRGPSKVDASQQPTSEHLLPPSGLDDSDSAGDSAADEFVDAEVVDPS